jgi:hypothetical protein
MGKAQVAKLDALLKGGGGASAKDVKKSLQGSANAALKKARAGSEATDAMKKKRREISTFITAETSAREVQSKTWKASVGAMIAELAAMKPGASSEGASSEGAAASAPQAAAASSSSDQAAAKAKAAKAKAAEAAVKVYRSYRLELNTLQDQARASKVYPEIVDDVATINDAINSAAAKGDANAKDGVVVALRDLAEKIAALALGPPKTREDLQAFLAPYTNSESPPYAELKRLGFGELITEAQYKQCCEPESGDENDDAAGAAAAAPDDENSDEYDDAAGVGFGDLVAETRDSSSDDNFMSDGESSDVGASASDASAAEAAARMEAWATVTGSNVAPAPAAAAAPAPAVLVDGTGIVPHVPAPAPAPAPAAAPPLAPESLVSEEMSTLASVARKASSMSREEEIMTARKLANDPELQRLVEAGVLSWKDIIQDKANPTLVSPAKLQAAVARLQALEERQATQYQRAYATYQKQSVMAYNRPIAGTNFTMWQPPQYARS